MYDEDLAIFKTNHEILKVGETLPFTDNDGKSNSINLFIIKLDHIPQRHTIATMSETMDGEPLCYLHNSIYYN